MTNPRFKPGVFSCFHHLLGEETSNCAPEYGSLLFLKLLCIQKLEDAHSLIDLLAHIEVDKAGLRRLGSLGRLTTRCVMASHPTTAS